MVVQSPWPAPEIPDTDLTSLVLRHAERLADRPAVCTLHHVPGPLTGRDALRERLAVAVGSHSAGLIMVSQASHDAFAARYPRSHRPDRWQVIRNGVDLQRFRPLTDAERPGLPEFGLLPGTPIVSMVAREVAS